MIINDEIKESIKTKIVPITMNGQYNEEDNNCIKAKRKAAAYARVSTERDEQQSSYKAQIDYYTKMITDNPNLEFVKVYTDEGISGTDTKKRKGFTSMINDALQGKIDIIFTKSISRFARNTVDSLTTIRKLKEVGCEVFFEKENIYTFDSKGELLITIMSSLAQEESRSLSENVTWGMRKRFADGKYTIHYKEFMGYERGEDNKPKINEYESFIIRRIFYMALQELSPYQISKILTNEGIKTPMGKDIWHYSVIKSILRNEKYKGDALLQKTYSTSFLTKKRKKNNGEVQQYYIENGHPAIVSKTLYEQVQKLSDQTKKSRFCEGDSKYSKRVKCSVCGNWYCTTIWKKKNCDDIKVWRCNQKYEKGNCHTPYLTTEEIEGVFSLAEKLIVSENMNIKRALSKLKTPARIIKAQELEIKEIERMISYLEISNCTGDNRDNVHISKIKERYCYLKGSISIERDKNEQIKYLLALENDKIIKEVVNCYGYIDELIDFVTIKNKQDFSVTMIDGTEISND